MQQPWYATREQVKRALDVSETARNNAQIDRAIASASRSIEALCHRTFYPWDGIKYIGYPRRNENSSWRLWLNEHDLVSVSSLTSGGTTVSASDYFLEPANSGPPFTSIELDLESNAAWTTGDTWQRNVVVTGTWGFWDEQESVGTLADNLDASLTDTANITWTYPSLVGVGSILKIDSERIIVTDTSFVDSTQNTGGSLTASAADVTVAVVSGTGFFVGEVIRVDSERMLVVDISGNNLVVKRAWDGSVLATHLTNTDVYGRTGIEISRAQLGSALAAHTSTDVVYRYVVPSGVNDLCIAEAVTQLQNEQSGYGKSVGSGEGQMDAPGRGLSSMRTAIRTEYGRKARHRAI